MGEYQHAATHAGSLARKQEFEKAIATKKQQLAYIEKALDETEARERSLPREFCTCPSCQQLLLNLDDGCGTCGWTRSQFLKEAVLTVNPPVTVSTPAEEAVLTVNPAVTVSTRKRKRGEGTGRIQWRVFTKKNGNQYQQPWYDWQIHQGEKTISRSTYIPKRLLSRIQELEDMKAPVKEILIELGVIK